MNKIIDSIFQLLDKSKIQYCHWKSNERLGSFLKGNEDLDLLFDHKDKDLVLNLFYDCGARKFDAIPLNKYENIFDYLIVDNNSNLIHFHLHFGLDIGEKGIKRYRMPFVKSILNTRVRSNPEGVWIIAPEYELLLLILRLALRMPPIVFLKYKFFNKRFDIGEKSLNEFKWLTQKVSFKNFESIILEHFDDTKIVREAINIYRNGLTDNGILKLRSAIEVKRRLWMTKKDNYVNLKFFLGRLKNHPIFKINQSFPVKRINESNGKTIVILGSDGAGKSTLVKNLQNVFSRKIDISCLYMGLPKPSKSENPLLAIFFRRIGLFPLWNLIIKKRNINKAHKFSSAGMLVIFDRFPQYYYKGIMDGPLMHKWSDSYNPVKRIISKIESNLFYKMSLTKIDLVIKLIVDSKTSAKRGQHSIKLAKVKTEIMNNLDCNNARKTIEFNATKMCEKQVLSHASSEIWKLYE